MPDLHNELKRILKNIENDPTPERVVHEYMQIIKWTGSITYLRVILGVIISDYIESCSEPIILGVCNLSPMHLMHDNKFILTLAYDYRTNMQIIGRLADLCEELNYDNQKSVKELRDSIKHRVTIEINRRIR